MSDFTPRPAPQSQADHAPSHSAKPHSANRVFVFLAIAVILLAVAVKFWGLIALTFAATAMVPVIFILFVIISWPF